ncbi:hypothetical protein B0J12DRAFT_550125, partial [Macrophomina phaseolina]
QSEYSPYIYTVICDAAPLTSTSAEATEIEKITDIRGSYTDANTAKQIARDTLFIKGYRKNEFETLDINESTTSPIDWKHGDCVYAYAVTLGRERFSVYIDTTPNNSNVTGNSIGEIEGPLFY